MSALPTAVEFRSIRRPIHDTTRIGLAESMRSMITISLRSSTPMWTVSAVRCARAASAGARLVAQFHAVKRASGSAR